jgi:hypothetical protein
MSPLRRALQPMFRQIILNLKIFAQCGGQGMDPLALQRGKSAHEMTLVGLSTPLLVITFPFLASLQSHEARTLILDLRIPRVRELRNLISVRPPNSQVQGSPTVQARALSIGPCLPPRSISAGPWCILHRQAYGVQLGELR